MDWSNEPYVKVYTRETDDDLTLSWEAMAIWNQMLKRFDRAGVIETKRGPRGLAAIVKIPAAVVERALPELLSDGRLREVPVGYLAPNFLPAQEARKSDRMRQRESRERRRDSSLSSEMPDRPVTKRDEKPENVTSGHTASHDVTLCSADPDPLRSEEASRRGVTKRDSTPDQIQPPSPPKPPGDHLAYDHEDPAQRGRLAEIKYAELSDRRGALAKRKGWPMPLPLPAAGGGVETQGFRDLRARIREEGASAPSVVDAMLDALEAEDAKNGKLYWLDERSFGEKAWRNTRSKLAIGARKPAMRVVRDEDDWPDLEGSPWAPPPGYRVGEGGT